MLALCLPAAASAATLQVANTNDSGPGSLRATMNLANPGDTIDIPAGTVTLTSGPLFPPVALTLVGAGAGSTAISGGTTQQRIMLASHDLNLTGITFEDGHGSGGGANAGGGAIWSAQDPLTVTASTVAGNAADLGLIEFASNGGGGLFNDSNGGAGPGGAVTLTNSTLVNNIVAGSGNGGNEASGGGIYDFGAGGTITNTTIAGNSASFRAGGAGGGGICENGTAGTLTLHNAIVAGNSVSASSPGGLGGRNCDFNPTGTKIVSAGHNISDDATCALTASGDQPNTTPGLGPLANNGGPTQTEALLPGSDAIDRGDSTGCPATDQRGVTRPVGSACDVGAYEYAPPATSATIVACSGTLRATLTPAAGSTVVALLVRIDGGLVRTIAASGNPAVVTVATSRAGACGRCLRGSKLAITIHAPPGVRLNDIVVTAGSNRVERRGRLPHVMLVPFPRAGFFTLHVRASGPGRVVTGSVRHRVC